jgi:BirA family biotin operon repressor/biotin-[acetyl-CoA-carboxylase] ligase
MQRLAERSAFAEQPIFYISECDSTMDEARALVSGPACHGTVVTTDFQRKGRGRRAGRTWHAPAGSSLMFTLALYRPEHPARQSMQMALALTLLLESRYSLSPQIKWPNDVLVSGKKIAGILADAAGDWVYLGVGINLTQESFPSEIADRAISLSAATGTRVGATESERPALLDELLANFAAVARGEVAFASGIEARLWRRGEQVAVEQIGGPVVTGVLRGVSRDGLLIVDGDRRFELAAGEVRYEREAPRE